MTSSVPLETARPALRTALLDFLAAAEVLDDWALLDVSRCYGWARVDLVAHVVAGLDELAAGLVDPTTEDPDVDADTYWSAFAAEIGATDKVAGLVTQRRRGSTYERPSDAVAALRSRTSTVVAGLEELADRPLQWAGHRFTAGDYLAVWTVETVVHHLDLRTTGPAPGAALALTRAVVIRRAAAVGASLPDDAVDDDVVLVGAGRLPAPADWRSDPGLFPVIG